MNKIIMHSEGVSYNLLYFEYVISKSADYNGYPNGKGKLKYILVSIEAQSDTTWFEYALSHTRFIPKIVFEIKPAIIGLHKTRYINAFDCNIMRFQSHFCDYSPKPMTETFVITAQGMEQSHSLGVFSTPFRKTFDRDSLQTNVIDNSPSIQSIEWKNADTEETNISKINYKENISIQAKIENADGGTASIKIRKKDGSEFKAGQKELTFTEAVNEEGIVEIDPLEIEEVWEEAKQVEIDELIAEVHYNGNQKTSQTLQITPIPKVIVEFRPSKRYNGEYGFDYLREKKKKDHTTYEDILGTNSTVKNPSTGLKIDKFTKYPTNQKYNDLISNHYGKIQLPWHKDTSGNSIDYIQSWLMLYPKEKATLSLQIETLSNPNKEDFTFDYDNTLFNLSTTIIAAQGKGKKRLHDHLTIECLKEFNNDQTIKVMFGNRQLGQLNILKNAKAHRKVAKVVFVSVKTELNTGKKIKGKTQNKKGVCEDEMLYKFLKQGYIKLENDQLEFDLTQLDPKTKKLKHPNFNKNFCLLDNTQTPPEKIVNKYHNTTNRKLVDFMETEFNKAFPTYANHFKVFFFGDRGGKKIGKAVWGLGGYAKGFNTRAVIVFNGSNEATVTHELLHAIGLKHSFSNLAQFSYQKGETYNIMDYSHISKYGPKSRNQIWYWQMKKLWTNSDLKPE